jgi:hypothetical protein
MSQYPQEYYEYYLAQYQAMQWQSIFTVLVGVAILVAMGAWALSLVRKAFKGEEVEFPL